MQTGRPLQTLHRALLAATLLAGSSSFAANISAADYSAAKSRINAEYKTDKDACDKLDGNAKDVCREEAKGKQRIARAELEYNHSGKAGDASKLAMTKAEAAYDVAKEKCDDLKGNEKDVCVKDAKAAEVKAKADAKASKTNYGKS